MSNSKIAIVTTAHERNDTRIFQKQIVSLQKVDGYHISLHVCDGLGNMRSNEHSFSIIDHGKVVGRLDRMLRCSWRIFKFLFVTKPDLVHFHDPEFLPFAVILRLRGVKVIYDVHEDLPATVETKEYIYAPIRPILKLVINFVEKFLSRSLHCKVVATPAIGKNFKCNNVYVVQNYPNYFPPRTEPKTKDKYFVYVGMISKIRGVGEVIDSLALMKENARLKLIGPFQDESFKEILKERPGWRKVDYIPWLERFELSSVIQTSIAGIVTFKNEKNHVEAQPNKMFEYMACGTPVIGSDFPLWRDIIENNEVGVVVNPDNSEQLAATLDDVVRSADKVSRWSENAVICSRTKYSWESEEKVLLQLYQDLLGSENR